MMALLVLDRGAMVAGGISLLWLLVMPCQLLLVLN
jgi:hypothetical protein